MLFRAIDQRVIHPSDGRGESVELMEAMKKAFETIAMAKVAIRRTRRGHWVSWWTPMASP